MDELLPLTALLDHLEGPHLERYDIQATAMFTKIARGSIQAVEAWLNSRSRTETERALAVLRDVLKAAAKEAPRV